MQSVLALAGSAKALPLAAEKEILLEEEEYACFPLCEDACDPPLNTVMEVLYEKQEEARKEGAL